MCPFLNTCLLLLLSVVFGEIFGVVLVLPTLWISWNMEWTGNFIHHAHLRLKQDSVGRWLLKVE